MADITKRIIAYLKDMDENILSMKDDVSDLIDISKLPLLSKEVGDLLQKASQLIDTKINRYDLTSKRVHDLFDQIDIEEKEIPSTSEGKTSETDKEGTTPSETDKEEKISLRPQRLPKDKQVLIDIPKQLLDTQHADTISHVSRMRELYALNNNDYRYVEFSGIYPRLNFLQIAPPEEVKYWFDFGSLNSVYTVPPDFNSIKSLPIWIRDAVRDCYKNNPTMLPKDILVLKFLSAGPDFYKNEKYPSYHFIQLAKMEAFSVSVSTVKKEFFRYEEKDIHYRRAIGIRIVLQGMEAAFKQGFRTYGGSSIHSSVMIAYAGKSPAAALNYLQRKIDLLERGIIKSSPEAQKKICQFRKHDMNVCPACTFDEEEIMKDTATDMI